MIRFVVHGAEFYNGLVDKSSLPGKINVYACFEGFRVKLNALRLFRRVAPISMCCSCFVRARLFRQVTPILVVLRLLH